MMIDLSDKTAARGQLTQLLAQRQAEGRQLDFKRVCLGSKAEDKQALCADVSALANTEGGTILFGIDEDSAGRATAMPGIPAATVNDEILRMESTLRSGLEPPVAGVKIEPIPVDDQVSVVVLRVERSWEAPHLVKCGASFRMYIRENRGNRPLAEREIRAAYERSGDLLAQTQSWQTGRLAAIRARKTPVQVDGPSLLIVQVAPVSAFATDRRIPAVALTAHRGFRLPGATGWDHRHNLDGFVVWDGKKAYRQLFASGCMEVVTGRVCGAQGLIASGLFEDTVIGAVNDFLKLNETLDFGFPILVSAALLGVEGMFMAVDFFNHHDLKPIDRSDLLLPEVLLREPPTSTPIAIRAILDAAWNASSVPASPNFRADGTHPRDGTTRAGRTA
jgi:hypothetical protein